MSLFQQASRASELLCSRPDAYGVTKEVDLRCKIGIVKERCEEANVMSLEDGSARILLKVFPVELGFA